MSPERFNHLLSIVGPSITKKPCRSRATISAAERLMVTLRYLSTGDSQLSQAFAFRMGTATVSNIVNETCEALWFSLKDQYLALPATANDWLRVAKEFEEEWNFPTCIGALDGKHIMIECPKNGGSAYFNYKNFHSIVLLAVCDAKYCFTIADIGGYGCSNDASILSNSTCGEIFENHPSTLKIPCPARFDDKNLPYVLLGDEIFPLRPWLMKPYPEKQLDETQRIFNYRLSRARRTIENAFGILSAKWRIFRKPIRANVNLAEKIVKATVFLHNYLRLTENANYIPSGFVDCEDGNGNIIPGNWRSEVDYKEGGMTPVSRIGGNRYTYEAGRSRDDFKDYFNSPLGEVPWQLDYVRHLGRIQHK